MTEKLEKEIVQTLQNYDSSYNGKYNTECLWLSLFEKLNSFFASPVTEVFRLYDLPEKDFVNIVESVALKEKLKTVDTSFLDKLRLHLKLKFAKQQKKQPSTTILPKVNTKLASSANKNKTVSANAPNTQPSKTQTIYTKDTVQQLAKKASTPNVPQQSGKSLQDYMNRVKKGNLEVYLNKEKELSIEQLDPLSKFSYTIVNGSKEPFRYMYDKHPEKSDILSDQLITFGEKILQKHQIEYTEPVGTIVGTETAFLGRILTDSQSADDRLNANSIVLEGFGDVYSSKSAIVKLQVDPSAVDHEFFPGQFVVVQGSMKDGKNLSISQIHSAIDIPVQTTPEEIQQNLRVLYASGPFTLEDDLAYTPLMDLLQVVKEQQPNLLLLAGPFVDKSHALIRDDSSLQLSYDELFESLLEKITKGVPGTTQVILIPSLEDVFHDFVYPQPPFVIPQQYSSNISSVSNPCILQCNGVTIGINNIDLISHVANRMYKTKPFKQVVDRALSCVKQCLDQNNFYPPRIPNDKIPLDYSLSKMLQMEKAPSILLCPSQREAFIRDIKGTVAINPKSLVMYGEGGLYCVMDIPKPGNVKEYDFSKQASIKLVRI